MSYAVQPARRVASEWGDRRYQGPKYRVALCSSISGRSLVTIWAPSLGRTSVHPTPRREWSGNRGSSHPVAPSADLSDAAVHESEGGMDGRVRHGSGPTGSEEPTNAVLRGRTAPLTARLHRLQPHVLPDPVRLVRERVGRAPERRHRLGRLGRAVPGDIGARRVPFRTTDDLS